MNTLLLYLIFITINIAGTSLAWLLTEHYPTRIARIKLFNRKPFSCRPCMTYHLIAIPHIILATLISSISYGVLGIIIAFIIFFYYWWEDKKQVQE